MSKMLHESHYRVFEEQTKSCSQTVGGGNKKPKSHYFTVKPLHFSLRPKSETSINYDYADIVASVSVSIDKGVCIFFFFYRIRPNLNPPRIPRTHTIVVRQCDFLVRDKNQNLLLVAKSHSDIDRRSASLIRRLNTFRS